MTLQCPTVNIFVLWSVEDHTYLSFSFQLHIFALGPHTRQMCHSKRSNTGCSKLSDYDDLCGRVSERYRLQGFYRAFMSTSTQWLANLFAGICMNANMINMRVSF
jgi:hypothetical protein